MISTYDTGVYQLHNGNWAFRFKMYVDGKQVSKRKTKSTDGKPFKSKREAINARNMAICIAKTNQPDLPSTIESKTCKEVYEEYAEKGRADRAYATIKKQDSLWKNHLAEAFGNHFVEDIQVSNVKDYLTHLYYNEGYAFRYVESFLKMFYLLFGQAYSRGYLSVDGYNKLCVNKDTKIKMPKLKSDDDLEIFAFSQEQCSSLDAYFRGTNAETAYVLGRYCGLRINECYGLKWNQVDLKQGIIRIEQQEQYQDGLIKLVPLKTRNAKRVIYMNNYVKKYFKRLAKVKIKAEKELAFQRKQNQRMLIDVDGSELSSLELVNTLADGRLQTLNSMKYHSRMIKENLGIYFKYHYLRHTYGTQLAVLNTPPHLLCNQMGHGNIQVTERYYIAISKNGIDVLQKNLEQL